VARRTLPLLFSLAATGGLLILGLFLRPAGSSAGPIGPQITTTPSRTPCPPPTPEALRVDPVTSPSNLSAQTLRVFIGNGRRVTVSGGGGTAEATVVANIAQVRVPLRPNTTHDLEVAAEVYVESGGNGCTYNYTLYTTRDRDGAPLRIVRDGYGVVLPLVRK
jgi:hypothetical protein